MPGNYKSDRAKGMNHKYNTTASSFTSVFEEVTQYLNENPLTRLLKASRHHTGTIRSGISLYTAVMRYQLRYLADVEQGGHNGTRR
jgi:hypothetical protein